MPFTFAHPSILMLLRRVNERYLSWTALIVGSIVPDMEYFIWLNSGSFLSHTLVGILIFNLPLTYILSILWQFKMRAIFSKRWPYQQGYYKSFDSIEAFFKNNGIKFLISSFVGILTHLVWDSVSHAKGYLAIHAFPFLIEPMVIKGFFTRPCYIVWYISSLIGSILILKHFIRIKSIKFKGHQFKSNSEFVFKILTIAAIIAMIRIEMGLDENVPRHLTIIGLGSSLYGLVICCLYESYKNKS